MENWELREHQGQPQGEELLRLGWAQDPEPEAPEGSTESRVSERWEPGKGMSHTEQPNAQGQSRRGARSKQVMTGEAQDRGESKDRNREAKTDAIVVYLSRND